ncbi:MAG TPA: hypothetical protein PKD72_11690, partial [Gemmatales bacterium]|nr:hypothetical protein [Gemmatales bacterium]
MPAAATEVAVSDAAAVAVALEVAAQDVVDILAIMVLPATAPVEAATDLHITTREVAMVDTVATAALVPVVQVTIRQLIHLLMNNPLLLLSP